MERTTSGQRQNSHIRDQRRRFNFSAAPKRSLKTAAIDQDRRTITDHQCVDSFTLSFQSSTETVTYPVTRVSSTIPDWWKNVSGTLRHQDFAVFSDASKVPDTFFNATYSPGRESGTVELVTRGLSYGCDSCSFEIITSCFAPHSSR